MRPRVVAAGIGILAVGAGWLPAAAGSPAWASGAASRPGWHIAQRYPAADGVWVNQVTASGPRNAWANWQACVSTCSGSDLLTYTQRWDGSAWRDIPVPSGLAADARSVIAIGSDSPSDAWLFTTKRVVLRWDGHRLTAKPIPSWVIRLSRDGEYHASASVFGPDNVWVFSAGHAARYQHRHWTMAKLPVVPFEVSAISAADIWLLAAPPSSGRQAARVLAHWNGRRWTTIKVPGARVPPNSTESVGDLAADNRGTVWLTRNIITGTQVGRTLYLLRWASGRWHRITFRKPTSIVDGLVPDGHGGVWLTDNGPRYRWYLDHYNARKWTRDLVPVVQGTSLLDVISLTWVPGTRSVFAGANYLIPKASRGIVGAMLKYNS
jgi:hypothetical protein